MKFVYWLILISVMGNSSVSIAAGRVVVAFDGFSGQQAPLWLASDLGLFQKHGIEVDTILIGNAAARTAAIAAGELHFSVGSGASPITSAVSGGDSLIIGTYYNRHLYSFATTPEIRNPTQDLKGKNIGVSGLGGASHLAVVIALRRLGIDEKSVTIVRAGGTSERVASLMSRRLAATVLIEPFTERAEKAGFPILLDLGGLKEAFPTISLSTTKRYLSANRERTKSFLKGMSEAIHIFKTRKDLALRTLGKWMKTQHSETLNLTYNTHAPRMDVPPFTDLSGIQEVLAFLSKGRPEIKDKDPKEFINETLLTELVKEGFFSKLIKNSH